MTIVFFSAQYLPTVGGVERYTHSLGQQLVQKGHRVLVVTSALQGLDACEVQEGIEIVRVPAFWLMGRRFPVTVPSAALRRAQQLVRQAEPALIVVQTRLYPLCLLGVRIAKKMGVPAIVIEHGTAHLLRGGIAGALGNVYEHAMMRLVRRYCDNLYGVSKACGQWLSHFGAGTDNVLYNAVDPAALQRLADDCDSAFLQPYLNEASHQQQPASTAAAHAQAAAAAACRDASLDARIPVIAFTGRFFPEKGILPLLEAFRTVRKVHPRAVLLLAGDGPQRVAVQAHLPEGAHLLGMLSYAQALALLARADIYCLPTFSEGFSTSVLEAAALRATILTTATGGSPELIVDAQHGILLPDMQPQSIAAALDRALASPAWRATAQENAFHRLTQQFTWDKVSDALLKIAAQGKQ